MSGSTTPGVAWLTEPEKVAVLRRCGYPAYGWLNTFDPFALYFPSFSQARIPTPVIDDRLAAVFAEIRIKLAELDLLDAAIVSSGDNLDTAQAAVWTHNANEVRDRTDLMRRRCRELCTLMGVEPGPALGSAGRRRLVV